MTKKRLTLFRLDSSIQKHVGSRRAAPVGGAHKIIFLLNIFSKKNVEKIFEFFFSLFFFVGSSPPCTLQRPWDPHAFGLRNLVGTGFCSTVFQQKKPYQIFRTFFFLTIFFLKIVWNNFINFSLFIIFFSILKCSETYANLFLNRMKKKIGCTF